MNVLREYLYVDLEKVNGFASQLYDGLPEVNEESHKSGRRGQVGSRAVALLGKDSEAVEIERRLLADALFPRIEQDLEAQGYLEDISAAVHDGDAFSSGVLKHTHPAGTIVRITAQGRLVDPRYFGRTMIGFATAVVGFDLLQPGSQAPIKRPASSGKRQQARNPNLPKQEPISLEDQIPEMPSSDFASNFPDTAYLRGMVKIMRGLYPEGLSMLLSPAGVGEAGITMRLQEGQQYLDAEPDVLFARYGLGFQEWTVVGTIGYHAQEVEAEPVDDLFDGQKINRGMMTAATNDFLSIFGNLGLTEVAQAPGFSIVPMAVYRVIPNSPRVAEDGSNL